MLKIGYNKSDKHIGGPSHLERPDRLNYCIEQLISKMPKTMIIGNITYSKNVLFDMIMRVHSEEHITNLLQFVPLEYICRNCTIRSKSKGMQLKEFIETSTICKTCKKHENVRTDDTVYCYLDPDTYYTAHTFNIVLDGIGVLRQLLDEMRLGSKYGFAIIRPPGHHCENHGSGFCILNNALIATKYAQEIGYTNAFILDIDFHHGDGTQNLLQNNPDLTNIRFCSIHGHGFGVYPGTGSRDTNTDNILNIPLAISIHDDSTRNAITDDFYLEIIQGEVDEFIMRDKPDIIIVSCGFDGHQNDTLQGFNLSNNAYGRIVSHLNTYNVPVLYVVEGGYNKYAISNSIFSMIGEMNL